MRGSALVILVVGVATLGVVSFQQFVRVEPMLKPLPEATSQTEYAARLQAAFQKGERPEVERELHGFFQRVARVTAEPFAPESAELFHFSRLYQAARATDQLPVPDLPVMDGSLVGQITETTMTGLRAGWLGKDWQRTSIRHVEKLGENECLVIARHEFAGQALPAQWWMIRTAQGWQAYDFEDLRLGLRLSTQLAGLFQEGPTNPPREKAVQRLIEAQTFLQQGNAPVAKVALDQVQEASLPMRLQPVYGLTLGAVLLSQNEPLQARRIADRLRELRPNMPGVLLLKATAEFRLGESAAAVEAAKAYIELLGPDPQVSVILGLASLQLGQFAEARQGLERALQEFPESEAIQKALERLNED